MRNVKLALPLCCVCFLVSRSVRMEACTFLRGDANLDSSVDISDPVRILNILFLGSEKPDCDDLLDSNDDGSIDISDGVFLLAFLFGGGASPPAPFPTCGPDETPDALGCTSYFVCSPTCVMPDAVLAGLGTIIAAGACVPTGIPPADGGLVEIQILPIAKAIPCGSPPSPGWPIQLTKGDGSIDLTGSKARVHLEGKIDDLPVVLKSVITSTTCAVDVIFSGDAQIELALVDSGHKLYFKGVKDVVFENVMIDLSTSGGAVCTTAGFIAEAFQGLILPQVEFALLEQIPNLNDAIGCREICTVE